MPDRVEVCGCEESLALREELGRLRVELAELKRQLTIQGQNNHRRNLQLDALHFVWCNGGCPTGVHRHTDAPVTEELVAEAERNTSRLRTWWENFKAKSGGRHG